MPGKKEKAAGQQLRWVEDLRGEVARLEKTDAVNRQTIEALRRSEAYFRAITQKSYDIIIIVDRKAKITYVNPAVERSLGYVPEELIGRSGFDYISLSDLPRAVYDFGRAILTSGIDIPNSFTIRHKDGTQRILEGVGRNLFNDPVVSGFVMTVRDVTGRKRAEEELSMYRRHLEDLVRERTQDLTRANSRLLEELAERKRIEDALRESENDYRDIMENSPIGFCIVDTSGKIQFINKLTEEVSGWSRKELIGKDGFSIGFFDDETQHLLRERLAARLKGDSPRLLEVPVLSKRGKRLWIEIKTTLLMKGGFPSGVQLAMTDNTERRKAEDALRESEAKYRSVLDNMQDIFCRIDLGGTLTMINAGFFRTLGYASEEDILGRNIQEFFHDGPGNGRELMEEVHGKGSVRNYEVHLRRSDGSRLVFSTNSHLHFDKRGKVSGIEGIFRDITDLKKAEEERSNLEKQLLHSQKMEAMGVLASGVAHDFNNLLMAIMGYAELMKVKTTDRLNHPYLDQLLSASGRAKELVNQILTFSRRKEGEKKPVPVTPIIKEVMRFLRSSLPGTVDVQHSYTNIMDTVIADATQIHQIIMNLCTNAVHAMRDRGGTLKVTVDQENIAHGITTCHPKLKEGHYLRISVSDTGHGIAPAIMDKIFDPFFTTKKTGEGTGLGLSVVYGIVRNHNGAIHVSSSPGEGAAFTVYLPLVAADTAVEAVDMEPVPGGKEHIMLVDDEEYVLSIEREMLASLGYDVSCRRSSLDALDAFRAGPERFDLVITDIAMPNMTGINLAREMLKIHPKTRIILATGFSEIFTEQEARDMGMKDFMTKPISLNRLARTVRNALDYQ